MLPKTVCATLGRNYCSGVSAVSGTELFAFTLRLSLHGSLESWSLRNGFASLCRLIDVLDDDLMFSEIFQPPSFCLKGSIQMILHSALYPALCFILKTF